MCPFQSGRGMTASPLDPRGYFARILLLTMSQFSTRRPVVGGEFPIDQPPPGAGHPCDRKSRASESATNGGSPLVRAGGRAEFTASAGRSHAEGACGDLRGVGEQFATQSLDRQFDRRKKRQWEEPMIRLALILAALLSI